MLRKPFISKKVIGCYWWR